jgi:hypothetical protein
MNNNLNDMKMKTITVGIAVSVNHAHKFREIIEARTIAEEKRAWQSDYYTKGEYAHFKITVLEGNEDELFAIGFQYGAWYERQPEI